MEENLNKAEAAVPSNEGTAPTAENKQPVTTLLGSISYSSEADYEAFLNGLTLEHAVVILIASANYAQAKGAFSLSEAELINKAIKRIRPARKAEQPAPTSEPTAQPETVPAEPEQIEQPPLDENQS
jgi:hypothetical protein